MFDRVTVKYAAIVAAGYGISLSDIGIQVTASGGETLAGSIRQERRTRKTGFARFKKKMKSSSKIHRLHLFLGLANAVSVVVQDNSRHNNATCDNAFSGFPCPDLGQART